MTHGGDIYTDRIEYDFSVNLNPLDCSAIYEELLQQEKGVIGHYPDLKQRAFREAIARVEGVSAEEVYGGNGASELLMLLALMIKPKRVLLPVPSFAGYRHAFLHLEHCKLVLHTLSEENGFRVDDSFLCTLMQEAQHGLDAVILTNPNNPTGGNISQDILLQTLEICKQYQISLLVDECFLRMSNERYSMVQHIHEYEGLYVINAYTKLFSIPSVRVGYVISQQDNIKQLIPFCPEWNLSGMAQLAGVVCGRYLLEEAWEERTREVIGKEREYLSKELQRLGIKVYESDTSFLLCNSDRSLFDQLKKQQILIRDCADYEGLSEGFYRVAVKGHAENEYLIQTLSNLLEKKG